MVCNTLDYWDFGFWILSIVRYSKEYNMSQTGSVPEMLCSLEYRTKDKVQKPSNPDQYRAYICYPMQQKLCVI
jgi:hypothetical protein